MNANLDTTLPQPLTPAMLAALTAAPKKSNHRVNVVAINEVFTHPDPETTNLERILIDGYQVVVRKGQFTPGDLAVYIQPDSVVPQTEPFRFLWEQHVGIDGTVPEKRRRITVRKFRGQWSEGLLLPVTDFPQLFAEGPEPPFLLPQVGEDVSDFIGVTHYDPDADVESTRAPQMHAPKRKYPKTLRGWMFFVLAKLGFRKGHHGFSQEVSFKLPTYDVESFKNHAGDFAPGELVLVTEKVHGSNARFVFLDGVMYAGSKTQWKAPGSNDVWNNALKTTPWITEWCKEHEGYALYGEVTPTQKGFQYGSKDAQFFLFDVRSPKGEWVPPQQYRSLGLAPSSPARWDIGDQPDNMVPVLYAGPFDRDHILGMVDGPSQVPGAKHIREGVVIKSFNFVRGTRGHRQLKIVSNAFLEKDSK